MAIDASDDGKHLPADFACSYGEEWAQEPAAVSASASLQPILQAVSDPGAVYMAATGAPCGCGWARKWMRKIPGLTDAFDLCVVISLRRTPDRLRDFLFRAMKSRWPLPEVLWIPAVDGDSQMIPHWWKEGGPAWGCLQSHKAVLRQALSDGKRNVLVLEDDAELVEDGAVRIKTALLALPEDWDCLMLGGQQMHDGKSESVAGGLSRVTQFERTHAYALSRSGMKSLLDWWDREVTGHCDWTLGDWQETSKTYAVTPVAFIQSANVSTIKCRAEPARSWDGATPVSNRTPDQVPVVWIKCQRETLEELIASGAVHAGYSRGDDGVDIGLSDAMKTNGPRRIALVESLASMLRSEATAFKGAAVALWGVEPCGGYPVLEGDSVPEHAFQLRKLVRAKTPWNPRLKVFWHVATMNNWQEVFRRQALQLIGSGIEELSIGLAGDGDLGAALADIPIRYNVVSRSKIEEYEIPTLAELQRWCKLYPDDAVCYGHTKGVSQPADPNKPRWCELMMRWVVMRWRQNLPLLKVADVCGIAWQHTQLAHFSGNFWLARNDWINRLPDIREYQRSGAGRTIAGNSWERMSAELWLGSTPYHEVASLAFDNENLWTGNRILDLPFPDAEQP